MNQQTHIPLKFHFNEMRKSVLQKLSSELPQTLIYHSYNHTLNVEKIAEKIALAENLNEIDIKLVQTAALYHDLGFIHQHENNEAIAIRMAEAELPAFKFSKEQIEIISKMIHSTRAGFDATNKFDKIMSDADHDYFGRDDYFEISDKLRKEFSYYGQTFTEIEWIDFQLNYVEKKHIFWTEWSIRNRTDQKIKNITTLKTKKQHLQ